MNIVTLKTPCGWQAYDEDQFDGSPWDMGRGDTEQEAIDDLCDSLGLPYSIEAEEELLKQQEWMILSQEEERWT